MRLEYQMIRLPAGITPDGDGWTCFHSTATYDDDIVWLWSRVLRVPDRTGRSA
jgi:hypothetical protein